MFRERWGLFVTLALVVSALTSVGIGLDLASVLVMAVALLAAVYGLRNPAIGVIGIGLLATVEPVRIMTLTSNASELSVRIPFNSVNYWLLFFCLANVNRIFRLRELQSKLHLLLIGVLLLGLLWTPTLFPQGVQEVFRLIAGFSLILYFAALPSSQHRALYWVALPAASVALIFGLVIIFDPANANRFNHNNLAMMPLTGLFTVFLAIFAKVVRRRETHLVMLLAAANLTFVILSGSRGAIVTGLFLWVAMLMWGVDLPRRIAYTTAGALVALGLAALSPQVQEYAIERLEFTLDGSESISRRTSGRWDLAMIGWRLFLEHPAGVGTGGFATSMATFYSPDVRFWDHNRAAHSAWIKVLSENGVLGIVVMFVYVSSFAWTGFRRRHYGLLPIGLVASAGLALRFATRELGDLGVWWFAAGCVFLLYRTSRPLGRRVYSASRTREWPARTAVPMAQSPSMPRQTSTQSSRRLQA